MDNNSSKADFELPVPNQVASQNALQPPNDVLVGNTVTSGQAMSIPNSSPVPPMASQPPYPAVSSLPSGFQVPNPLQTTSPQQPLQNQTMLAAGNADRIEKVWVDKARAIIARTMSDPALESRAISALRAEYLQARFKKQLPRSDG